MDTSGWLKGNTHVHTVRSDGNSTVAQVVAAYASLKYDFLVVTDHNRYLRQEESRVELPAGFVLIAGSELSCKSAGVMKPVDVCSLGGDGEDPPGHKVVMVDGGVRETLKAALGSIRSAGGLPVVCHPCWRWALNAEDLAAADVSQDGDYLLEIMNPSCDCNNYGAGGMDSPEDIWSKLLSAGRRVWGVAADDAHHVANPTIVTPCEAGRAWVRVGSRDRTAAAILEAIRAGRFYSSTGVELDEIALSATTFSVKVRSVRDWKYTVRFLGSGNRELAVSHSTDAVYNINGDEGFVRARIEDSAGFRAWTQPQFL